MHYIKLWPSITSIPIPIIVASFLHQHFSIDLLKFSLIVLVPFMIITIFYMCTQFFMMHGTEWTTFNMFRFQYLSVPSEGHPVPVLSANLCTFAAMCENTDKAHFLLFVPELLCHCFACITCPSDTYWGVAMY